MIHRRVTGHVLIEAGRPEEARQAFEDARQAFEEAGDQARAERVAAELTVL